jgi:protein-tyrosine phosphatase
MRYPARMPVQPPERRSRERSPFEVAWVEFDTAPGRLGLAMAPGRREAAPGVTIGRDPVLAADAAAAAATAEARGQRDLHSDLRRLRHVHRCDVLVSLLHDAELRELGIAELAGAVAIHGIEHHRLPVRDGSVPEPEQLADVLALIDQLRGQLLAGRTLVLHCRAGQGRAGMLAALLVTSLWELPADAIARVRRAQPRAVESVQQEHYVHDTAFAWFKHHIASGAGL